MSPSDDVERQLRSKKQQSTDDDSAEIEAASFKKFPVEANSLARVGEVIVQHFSKSTLFHTEGGMRISLQTLCPLQDISYYINYYVSSNIPYFLDQTLPWNSRRYRNVPKLYCRRIF